MTVFSKVQDADQRLKHTVFMAELSGKARKARIPCQMHLEITPLCTLDCKMCYVHLKKDELPCDVLDADEWIRIAREALQMGVLYVTLSGGECLAHKDFFRIYKELYDMGFAMTVMTNGTLIDERVVEFFLEYPPEGIYITVYGFCNETYGKVCGVPRAFDAVIKGINLLTAAGLPLKLHTTLTREMMEDIPQIAEFARKKEVPYRFSNVLAPTGVCSEETVQENYVTDEEYSALMKHIYPGFSDERGLYVNTTGVIEKGLLCGAARDSFSVNWKGEMRPCVSLENITVNLKEKSVKDAWEELTHIVDDIPLLVECQNCLFQNYCTRCVAMHYADTQEYGKPSPRLCWKRNHPEEAARMEAEFAENQRKGNGSARRPMIPVCPDEM